ncbi:efflux RND transporter periplasmic adaptor subunit [Marinobacterium rhizophilum]|uniref:Efflux RND transporter periplasmic adaptor subunit n=1 Tax=Marinobacterium rhizophilum TaxID=420402 RepID=A0ABY5HNB4_9GAMM|nr:efflux RND transporter periplasmic adaptor subunit [Marinobacterium rhizophilum]UTW12754.1 efflux RND transporter periplasmic adaptor subunit [Marinobacterium rhizophilum]
MRVIGVLCLSLALPAWGEAPAAASEYGAAVPADPYGVDGELPALDCLISPGKVVNISSPVPGVIDRLHVERGDLIESAAPVAELESEIEKATLALALTRAQMVAESEGERVNVNFDQLQQERFVKLSARNMVAQRERDEAQRSMQLSRWRLQQSEELRRVRQHEYLLAEAQLKQKHIQSPISGRVVDVFRHAGEYVDEEPILQVAQLDPLRVEVIVPMHLYGRVEAGMTASVYPEVTPTQAYEAKVTLVDPVGDAASGTFGVRLELANPQGQLPAGMKCALNFATVTMATADSPAATGLATVQEP